MCIIARYTCAEIKIIILIACHMMYTKLKQLTCLVLLCIQRGVFNKLMHIYSYYWDLIWLLIVSAKVSHSLLILMPGTVNVFTWMCGSVSKLKLLCILNVCLDSQQVSRSWLSVAQCLHPMHAFCSRPQVTLCTCNSPGTLKVIKLIAGHHSIL